MPLESTLALVEQQLEQVSGHLLANEALALESSSADLRSALVLFSQAMAMARHQALSPALVQRLQAIQMRLAAQRQALARIAAGTDRLAEALLPSATQEATYGRALGVRSVSAAGARIYSSARQH